MLEVVSSIGQGLAKSAPSSEPKPRETRSSAESTPNVPNPKGESGAVLQRLDPIEKIENALTKLLSSYMGNNTRLSIEHHKATGRYIYRSIDEETGEVIAQWPAENFLTQLEALVADEPRLSKLVGVAIDEHA
jgi:uncharacterized FlaG/YvyC family protein